MATRIIGAVALAAICVTPAAATHLSAPLVPTALVEDVNSAGAGVEFMDYVGTGQVIKLAPHDVLVLSYLKSCEHETITGGTVVVGAERSDIKGGTVARSKVPCDGGKIALNSQEASNSAATAFRVQSAAAEPAMLHARAPIVKIPRLDPSESRMLVIDRTDRHGEHIAIKLDESLAGGGYYDFAKNHTLLTPGATYNASVGDRKVTFKLAANAKSGKAPAVSRLVRFQLN
jgi:hypothetical protein